MHMNGLHSTQVASAFAMLGCRVGCRTRTCTYLAIDKDLMHLCCLYVQSKVTASSQSSPRQPPSDASDNNSPHCTYDTYTPLLPL
jgi:hypothetical protein